MKPMSEPPPALFEAEREDGLPPGGGLVFMVLGSFLFWAVVLWAVL